MGESLALIGRFVSVANYAVHSDCKRRNSGMAVDAFHDSLPTEGRQERHASSSQMLCKRCLFCTASVSLYWLLYSVASARGADRLVFNVCALRTLTDKLG